MTESRVPAEWVAVHCCWLVAGGRSVVAQAVGGLAYTHVEGGNGFNFNISHGGPVFGGGFTSLASVGR